MSSFPLIQTFPEYQVLGRGQRQEKKCDRGPAPRGAPHAGWPAISAVVQESRLSGNQQEGRKLFLGISEDFYRQVGWLLRKEEGPPGLVEKVSSGRKGWSRRGTSGELPGDCSPGHSERAAQLTGDRR